MEDIACRVARPQDAAAILDLLLEGHSSDWPFFSVNRDKALGEISRLIEEGIVLVAEQDSMVIGSISFDVHEWWFSDDVFLCEVWTFVRPESRQSKAAETLLRRARALAEEAETPLVVGIFSPHQAERKNKLFRRFFKPVGEIFAHGVGSE